MWTVKAITAKGAEVKYNVPASKDTEKAFVLALAFQQHGQQNAEDPLTPEASVEWTSDSVVALETPIVLKEGANYAVDRRVSKGVWERHSPRAYRSAEAAEEAMESAASEFPSDRFRIVCTQTSSRVVSVSKNAFDIISEEPDAPKEEVKAGETKADAPKEEVKAQTPPPAKKPTASKPKAA